MAIKLLIMDVDGTLTDGKIYMGNNGEVMKAFDIKDGYAIHNILPLYGIIPVIITARQSDIVLNRCKELGIDHCYQGVSNKKQKLIELMAEFDCKIENIAYIGDDLIDLECMQMCGIRGCPADAVEEVKSVCNFISTKNGGNGAVREFIEWIVKTK